MIDLKKCDAVWRLSENKSHFVVGNKCHIGGGEVIPWEHKISLETGKDRTHFERPLNPKQHIKFKQHFVETINSNQRRFFSDFLENLIDKKFNGKTVYPIQTEESEKYPTGLMFLKENGDPLFSIHNNKIQTGFYLIKGEKKNFFCLGLREGQLLEGITRGNIFVFGDYETMKKCVLNYAHKNPEQVYYVLGKNPSAEDLATGKSPSEFRSSQTDDFGTALNILVKFPPFMGFGEKESPKTFADYYAMFPLKCEENLNDDPDDFPCLRVLGHEGRAIWLWSKHLRVPLDFFQSSKFSELELVASPKYWKDKFKTSNPGKIVESLYNIARGKVYESHKVRSAGIYKENKNLIINTGAKIIGDPDPEENFLYLKTGSFPEPDLKTDIDRISFALLHTKILSNMGFRDINDGLSLFAWAVLSIFAKALPMRFTLAASGDQSAGKNFTKDQILLPLQERFKYIIKEFHPGCTYASFKEDLRSGVSVLYFEEEEGKTYDEGIQKIIRSSTYKEAEISQMRRTGGSLSTPVSFMRYTSFNEYPSLYSEADKARTYEINYSLTKLHKETKKLELTDGLIGSNLPRLGFQCYKKLYRYWPDFIKYYEGAKTHPQLFGWMIGNHKKAMYSQLYAFFKTLGLISKDEMDKYINFLKNMGEDENRIKINDNIVLDILDIPWKDWDHFKSKDIMTLLMDIEVPEDLIAVSDKYKYWKRWMEHLYYKKSIHLKEIKEELFIVLPCKDTNIIKGLMVKGYSDVKSKSYDIYINSEYGTKKVYRMSKKAMRGVAIPLKDTMPVSYFRKILDYHFRYGIDTIYK